MIPATFRPSIDWFRRAKVPVFLLPKAFRIGLASLAALAIGGSLPAHGGNGERRIELSYVITLAGIHIGSVQADGVFNEAGYALTLTGATGGITQLMTDANAWMAANGLIRGGTTLPLRFEMGMEEGGVAAEAQMRLADKAVMDLTVHPGLAAGLDMVPLTLDHVQGVVDPMSALFVPIGHLVEVTGEAACNRTLSVFDGWQRYDISMRYRDTETVFGSRANYSGPAFVCAARYAPIAGHSLTKPSVGFMSHNDRLAVWLVPAGDLPILIPFRLLIGTEIGDLIIRLDRLSVS